MNAIAIVTDIEGTTSSIDFVHNVLFPYAARSLPDYLRQHSRESEISAIIADVKAEINRENATLDEVIATLLAWIEADRKITPLKTLQGFIWENGFKKGEFKGHIYEDAYRNLQQWRDRGLNLYVYSSGSKKAQKLLFGYTEYGDLNQLFNGYFDTTIGNKKDSSSYKKIAKEIGTTPDQILFLSDAIAELDAASTAGYRVILLVRNEMPENPHNYPFVRSFDEIKINR